MILENLWSISRLPTSLQHSKNHDILLKKLEHYGICDKSNKWLRSFLEDLKSNTPLSTKLARSSDKPSYKYWSPPKVDIRSNSFYFFIP